MRAARLLITLLSATAGCDGDLVFSCTKNAQCVREGETGGTCVAAGTDGTRYCAFDDDACPSGRRFDDTAGGTFSGKCTGGTSDRDLAMPSEEDMTMVPEGDMAMPPTKLTWKAVVSPDGTELDAITGTDAQHIWTVGYTGIFFTADGGQTWIHQKAKQANNEDARQLYAISMLGKRGWAGGFYNQVYSTTDYGLTWKLEATPADESMGIWAVKETLVYSVGYAEQIVRFDGAKWTLQRGPDFASRRFFGIAGEPDGSAAAAVGHNGMVFETSDSGATWKEVASGTDKHLFGVWGTGMNNLYAVGQANVILHRDAQGWVEVRAPTGNDMEGFAGVWGSGDDVFVVGSGGQILHSNNGGKSWVEEDSKTSSALLAIWGVSATDVYVVGVNGVVRHGTP